MENNFAVPVWKMPTNGKRFRAEKPKPTHEKVTIKFLTKSKGPTAGVTGKGGIWRRKPPDAESAAWDRLPESAGSARTCPVHAVLGLLTNVHASWQTLPINYGTN